MVQAGYRSEVARMQESSLAHFRTALEEQKRSLEDRLGRIKANVRRGFNADSGEMAKELEDQEVVDALGNEAKVEIRRISDTLERMNAGEFGKCVDCGDPINPAPLAAAPYAERCIDCANEVERAHA